MNGRLPLRSQPGARLTAMTALLPAATRTRWCEEWLGELHTLPARRDRGWFAAHTLLGIPRLALTLRRPTWPATGSPHDR
jgi:GTP pyrophosphokinase